MRVPVIRGVIVRRLLVNYRVEPAALAGLLPSPFRPTLVAGRAVAGICLIGLAGVRPRGLPAALGITSENAAHRIAMEWEEHGVRREGVYIPRRDTSSHLNALLGGRLFPGVHHRARFTVRTSGDHVSVSLRSLDDETRVAVAARPATALPPDSVFGSLSAASAFFEAGAVGYSPGARPGTYDGLELRTEGWRVEPLAVEHVASSFFEDPKRFPAGTVSFDCALLMRGVPHEWHAQAPLCTTGVVAPAT